MRATAARTRLALSHVPDADVVDDSRFLRLQGVPLYHFKDNEAHNNGRYGLRIFTGLSPHNGEGMPGFYPKAVDPCAPVSEVCGPDA